METVERGFPIAFGRLSDVDPVEIVSLMNDPLVRRHMPLARDAFDAGTARAFVDGKEAHWAENGFGPWAFLVDGRFVGWGGFQLEVGEIGLALVLHPDCWGRGVRIADILLVKGFEEMGFASVVILLPPSRPYQRALRRYGFVDEGEVTLNRETFLRHRLTREAWRRKSRMVAE